MEVYFYQPLPANQGLTHRHVNFYGAVVGSRTMLRYAAALHQASLRHQPVLRALLCQTPTATDYVSSGIFVMHPISELNKGIRFV